MFKIFKYMKDCPIIPCVASNIKTAICGCGKNTIPTSIYKTKILKPNNRCGYNILTQCMLDEENTKYIIKYDYTLLGEKITVPENCILEFDGGSLKNGTIVGQDTFVINVGDVEIWGEDLKREGTWKEYNGNYSDKEYDPEHHSGLGRKVLKLKPDGSNILTQEDFSDANTIYVIQYDFDLNDPNGEINIPHGCVLEFDGGTLSGENTLSGSMLKVKGDFYRGMEHCVTNCSVHDENGNLIHYDGNLIDFAECRLDWGELADWYEIHLGRKDVCFIQSIVMTENYIFRIGDNDNNSLPGLIAVFNRANVLQGYVLVENIKHANDATICGNFIYVLQGSGTSVAKISIQRILINFGNTISPDNVITPSFTENDCWCMDYDKYTDKFYFASTESFYVCDTNFENAVAKYQGFYSDTCKRLSYTTGGIIIQGMCVVKGVVYMPYASGTYNSYQGKPVIVVYDLYNERMEKTIACSTSIANDEIEAPFIDPLTGIMYAPFTAHGPRCVGTYAILFTSEEASKYEEYNYDRRNVVGNKTYQRFMLETPFEQIFVNNDPESMSYNKRPYGSADSPYRSIGEAIVMGSMGKNRICIKLASTDIAYEGGVGGFDGWLKDANIEIVGPSSERAEYILRDRVLLRNSAVYFKNIAFKARNSFDSSNLFMLYENTKAVFSYCDFYLNSSTEAASTAILLESGSSVNADNIAVHGAKPGTPYTGYKSIFVLSRNGAQNCSLTGSNTFTDCTVYAPQDTGCDMKYAIPASITLNNSTLQNDNVSSLASGYFEICSVNNLERLATAFELMAGSGRRVKVNVINDIELKLDGYIPRGEYVSASGGTRLESVVDKRLYSLVNGVEDKYETNGENLIVRSESPEYGGNSILATGKWRLTEASAENAPSIIDVSIPFLPGIKRGFQIDTTTYTDISYSLHVEAGKTYTFSCWAKGTGIFGLRIGLPSWQIRNFSIDTEDWQFFSFTFIAKQENIVDDIANIYLSWSAPSSDITICAPKFEKGNHATLWSQKNNHGPSTSRPAFEEIGARYFDTTLNKPIFWTGDTSDGKSGWVDAIGTDMPNSQSE